MHLCLLLSLAQDLHHNLWLASKVQSTQSGLEEKRLGIISPERGKVASVARSRDIPGTVSLAADPGAISIARADSRL
jgi:hypothetical protein